MMDVLEALKGRLSVRAYLGKPVSRETVTKILDATRWSPSGGNLQPWQVMVVSGKTRQQLSNALVEAFDSGIPQHPEIPYYPDTWVEPYQSRRFACGMALYRALNIQRNEKDKRRAAWRENYEFFGAPIGLLFFLQRGMGQGAWVDMGIFLQSIMLTAHSLGLGTCPQASLADYPDIVRSHLGISDDWLMVCGMSLGYPDMTAAVNQYRTERESINNFSQWFE